MSRSRRGSNWRAGLSLIEVMINLAIVAVLLLAVCVALRAMLGQFRGNETALRSRQTALVTLDYMLAYTRQANAVSLGSTPSSTAEITSNQLQVLHTDPKDASKNELRTFRYDSQGQALLLKINDGAESVVLRNVTSLQFRARPDYDALEKDAIWRSITVDMTLNMSSVAGKVVPATFSGTTYARAVPVS